MRRIEEYEDLQEQRDGTEVAGHALVAVRGISDDEEDGDDEIVEIPGWPENDFDAGPRSPQLRIREFTTAAVFIGFLLRALVTYANSFEEVLSIFDFIAILGAHIFGDSFFWPFLITLFFSVSGYVTWRFWTPAVQEYTAAGVDWIADRLRRAPMVAIPRSNPFIAFVQRRYLAPIFETRGWLGYVTVASSVALLGMVANENEEGTRDFFGIVNRSFYTIGFSLLLASFSLLFSIVTDLHMIWEDRFIAEGRPRPPRRAGAGMYIIVTLGMAELVYRTYIVTYITAEELTGSPAGSHVIAAIVTLFGTIQNFCFQAVYALDGSPLIGAINRGLLRMPMPVKIIFLGANGITVVAITMVLSTYNMQTILMSNFNVPFRAAIIVGGVHAFFIATGDFITSFLDGVMRITLGWDLPPEMRFIQGHRSPPVLDNVVRAGRFRVAYVGGQERHRFGNRERLLPMPNGNNLRDADSDDERDNVSGRNWYGTGRPGGHHL